MTVELIVIDGLTDYKDARELSESVGINTGCRGIDELKKELLTKPRDKGDMDIINGLKDYDDAREVAEEESIYRSYIYL